jgi:hypothetical protein
MTTLRVAILCVAAGGALLGQSYNGSITSAGCSGITGWAWNSASPQTTVDVALYNGTAYLGSWPASAYSAPNGNDYSGFTIPIPSTLQDNQVHALTVSYGAAQTNGTQINIPIGNSTTQFTTTIQCAPTSAGYQYYFTDSFSSINGGNWTEYGSVTAATGEGLVSQTNGSLISSVTVHGPNSNNYEVSSDVVLQAAGGDYVQYLRASGSIVLSDGSTGQGPTSPSSCRTPSSTPPPAPAPLLLPSTSSPAAPSNRPRAPQ